MIKFDNFKITACKFDGQKVSFDEVEIEDDIVIEEVRASFDVELVYSVHELSRWAESNGYIRVKEEEEEHGY